MKVAYLTGRYPSVSHTFVLHEARALRERGLDVEPYSIWRSDAADLLAEVDRDEAARTYNLLPPHRLDWARAHLRALRHGPRAYLGALGRSLRLSQPTPRGVGMAGLWFAESIVLWDRCRDSRVEHIHVHLNGTAPSVALIATVFAEEVGEGTTSWSLTVHGPSEFYDVERERLPEKARGADAVVCISDFARSQLMGMVDERQWAKLHVVHCGIDSGVFAPGARDGDAPPGSLHVLTVGRLTQVKGQAVLLDAIAQARADGLEVTATLVGDGPKRAELERLRDGLDLGPHVEFAGAVGHDEIRAHYQRADLFCISSFAEGVPVVLMEAMAMELPVVAPAVMGIVELIEDGKQGLLVRPGRPGLLAGAISALARDPTRRMELGRAGRKKVLDEFTIDGAADLLAELFAAQRR